MRKYLLIFASGLLLGALVCFGLTKLTTKKFEDNSIEINRLEYQIDSLKCQIDSLDFCIENTKTQIDTFYVRKTKIEYVYEEKDNEIRNQSADADWLYYTEFLRSRFPSDSSTVETN